MISTAIKVIPLRPNRILLLTQIAFSGVFSTCAVAQTTVPLPTYPCQPVAYLFRHAEDIDTDLTPAGYRHAQIYPNMIQNFERTRTPIQYCPVARVYSEYYILPSGFDGTKNPYKTAEPLAADKNTDEDPATPIVDVSPPPPAPIVGVSPDPLQHWYLYEYLQSKASPTVHSNATVIKYLIEDMSATLNKGGSVAVYWTSAGMYNFSHFFGENIINPNTNTDDPTYKPPRNSVYVYLWNETYDGVNPVGGAYFKSLIQNEFVQCFNFNYVTGVKAGVPYKAGDKYYCQSGGSLDPNNKLTESVLKLVDGKICQKSAITTIAFQGTDVYGYCQ
jgi:hypothetical protein